MNRIQQFTSDPLQKQKIQMADGSVLSLTFCFKPQQYGWFIQELVYGSFSLYGVRICVSPNMLHQFKNQIPFGIACLSTDSREPTEQQDFSSGAANLYLLTADEVNYYTEYLSGQVGA
jgi:hypothetical protein